MSNAAAGETVGQRWATADAVTVDPVTVDPATVAAVTVRLPDSSPPVMLNRVAVLPGGGQVSVVWFPPNFERPTPGYYPTDEEFLLLSGDLTVNDTTAVAGDFVFIAAGTVRHDTRSQSGAVAVARFDRRADWVRHNAGQSHAGPPAASTNSGQILQARCDQSPRIQTALGQAHILRDTASTRTLLLEEPEPTAAALGSPTDLVELIDLRGATWNRPRPPEGDTVFRDACGCRYFRLDGSEPLPDLEGPVLVGVRRRSSGLATGV